MRCILYFKPMWESLKLSVTLVLEQIENESLSTQNLTYNFWWRV